MVVAALFLIVAPFLAGILVCTFIGVLFGPRGIWPANMVVMLALAVAVLRWASGCLGPAWLMPGEGAALICSPPAESYLATLLILIGLPLACLMIAAAGIIVERTLNSPQLGHRV